MLREDPRSIFSQDVEIENTAGPVAYDVSRVVTGTLEGMCSVSANANAQYPKSPLPEKLGVKFLFIDLDK